MLSFEKKVLSILLVAVEAISFENLKLILYLFAFIELIQELDAPVSKINLPFILFTLH